MITPSEMGLKEKTVIPPKGGWKKRAYYVVDVAYTQTNIIHRAIFYTGFLNGPKGTPGGYEQIFNPSYEECNISWRRAYYIKAISEIQEMKDQP